VEHFMKRRKEGGGRIREGGEKVLEILERQAHQ
jgi:hypothetical protein